MKKVTLIAGNPFGVFANLFWMLRNIRVAEVEGRIPIVYWCGGIYWEPEGQYNGVKGSNIWDYFFEPVSKYPASMFQTRRENYGAFAVKSDEGWMREGEPSRIITVGSKKFDVKVARKPGKAPSPGEPEGCWEIGVPPRTCLYNPNEEIKRYVNGLLSQYVKVKPVVMNKIDKFYDKHMKGRHMLGVHIRAGIDYPAGHGQIDKFIDNIDEYLTKYPEAKLFVASATHHHLDYIKKIFKGKAVHCKALRSKKGRWLFNTKTRKVMDKKLRQGKPSVGAKVAEEVLIEVMLLSRCNTFYHGMSNVSSAVTFLSPDMPSKFVAEYTREQRKEFGFDY